MATAAAVVTLPVRQATTVDPHTIPRRRPPRGVTASITKTLVDTTGTATTTRTANMTSLAEARRSTTAEIEIGTSELESKDASKPQAIFETARVETEAATAMAAAATETAITATAAAAETDTTTATSRLERRLRATSSPERDTPRTGFDITLVTCSKQQKKLLPLLLPLSLQLLLPPSTLFLMTLSFLDRLLRCLPLVAA